MYRQQQPTITSIRRNTSTIGESIEAKVRRIRANKEPIKDGAQPIYTERKDGVIPEYDPRADRMERALEQMDSINKGHKERRGKSLGSEAVKGMNKEAGNTPPLTDSQQS